ncbi:RsmB/NOP family class I SAM-dependent RNA methyltransferase [Flavihumibacter sp. R14]|nr:RsmB/NOP family class I SAM-dependent RNA methyltransferase [Flavihumibacter soli]
MRAEQQLRTFLKILGEYPADTPLTKFLPGFFKKNKQMGSTDRRMAARLLYNYFRLGQAAKDQSVEKRLFMAEFLCNSGPDNFLQHFDPDLNEKTSLPLTEKLAFLSTEYGLILQDVFPFHAHLSVGIDSTDFLDSFFVQPDLYIRIHSGKEKLVKSTLTAAGVTFEELSVNTISMPNGTKLDQIFADYTQASPAAGFPFEIQDLSSQQTLTYYRPQRYEHWWDACAASGGKSLLLFSEEPDIKLVVSDIRESVLNNLDERFIGAGLRTYQKKLVDLTQNPDPVLHNYNFDGIILDAPCTGSGTWGRTPEMISQFEEFKIQGFQNLQKTIAANVVKYLKPGKPLIYITCSVFKEENEDVVTHMVNNLGLTLEASQILKGYQNKADTMFVARLIKG